MNSTISTKIITYIIVDFKSHVQFKNFDEKRLSATTTNCSHITPKMVRLTQKSNIFRFSLKILCSLLVFFKSFK